jgi:ATP-binding protein involved in chromosome partitioning
MSETQQSEPNFSHGFMMAEARQAIADRLSGVKHILIVMSGKGGVGKSTVAVNLACALAKKGKKVGLLDADLHGPTIPTMLGLEKRPEATELGIIPLETAGGVKVISLGVFLNDSSEAVIWRGPMKMGAIKQFLGDVDWGQLDYLIIDCPPGTGDEPLSLVQLIPNPAGAIIVTTPQEVALAAVRKSVNFTQRVGLKLLGIVENFAGYCCPHCHEISHPFGQNGGSDVAKFAEVDLLTSIPIYPEVGRKADAGQPIGLDTEHPVGKLYAQLAGKIDERLNPGNTK